MKKIKKIPKFSSEEEERDFWNKNNSMDFINWKNSKKEMLPNLKPSSHTISIRMPDSLIDRLKLIANKKDITYQSLIKSYLYDKVKQDF